MILLASYAVASIDFSAPPQVGQEIVVTVTANGRPARGETLRVIHHPGTRSTHERAIGITDARGKASWTPEVAGTYELRAGPQTATGRLPWPSPPLDALVLLLVLLGTAGATALLGLRRQTRKVR